MKTFQVQMTDFAKIFLRDKSLDGCFACKSTAPLTLESNMIDDLKKRRQRFFDLDKVLKEIETKEMRKHTIQSLTTNTQTSHRKAQSIHLSKGPCQIQIAKERLR